MGDIYDKDITGQRMPTFALTLLEKRAITSISLIIILRMIALFMALPLFALYASTLQGATPFLIGLALGIYGLFQAIFQIPFGMLSDQYGRKPIIAIGLLLFIAGSILSGFASSIWNIILGRALQGAGAVGGTLLALLADCTRIEKRAQAMAIAGIGIGLAFGLAMLLGPLLNQWINVGGIFLVAACLGAITLILLYTLTPTPLTSHVAPPSDNRIRNLRTLLTHPDLWRLNSGIFILHCIFSANFVAIPFSILQSAQLAASKQWVLYVPSLLLAFPLSFMIMGFAEHKRKIKLCFLLAIGMLCISEVLLLQLTSSLMFIGCTLSIFFTGFSLLEGFLPSLVSRSAPRQHKGSALGMYSCAQFFGIFTGGTLGGFLYGYLNISSIYLFSLLLSLVWLILAFSMQSPPRLISHILKLQDRNQHNSAATLNVIETLAKQHLVEVHYVAEEHTFYLKMHDTPAALQCFLQLKETVES